MKKQELVEKYRLSPDEEIVRAIVQEGLDVLFELIHQRYQRLIYQKCWSIVRDQEAAKDLTQDILVKILTQLPSYKGLSKFSFWVYSISYNHCIDHIKKEKKLQWVREEDELAQLQNIAIDEIEAEHQQLKELRLSQLEVLLGDLKTEDRIVLSMRYYSNMPVKLIAQTLQIGESAVKMRLKRGRKRLAELMNSPPSPKKTHL